nr:MATE family efflux transporter [Halobellus captivus]
MLTLGWPIAVQEMLNTLMRTVDIIVTGLFSPAAVAAIGLADLYAQIPLRVGLGLGAGSIALSSQDTGRGATLTRDESITQALLIGAVCGIPIVIVGLLFSHSLIEILGANSAVVRQGGIYLAIIFAVAPMRIIGLVGSRALQGASDTRTPMLINVSTNVINILLTVSLGLGIWIAPRWGIIGVGVATAISRTFEAFATVSVIGLGWTSLSFTRPESFTITRQLITISIPTFAEGMATSLANFPFNALLLLFGTEVNAAFHIGRRIYQQVSGPLHRTFSTVTSIMVGQELGAGDPGSARNTATVILGFSVITLTIAGSILFVSANQIVGLFTQDASTLNYAVTFTRVFAVSMFLFGIFFPLAGALRGAGDTRTPFYARLIGSFVVMLGGSYLLGIVLNLGLMGIYMGIVLSYICWVIIIGVGFLWGSWENTAESMISERVQIQQHRN